MTQLYPSTEYESKAVALIMELRSFILDAQSKLTPEEVSAKFRDIQSRFSQVLGKPLTEYEPFVKGEPLKSDKVNRFISNLQKDINILEEQVELIRATSLFMHNTMNDQLDTAKSQNAAAINKLKSLQLYTSAQNNEITIFGDYFKDDSQIDDNEIKQKDRALIDSERRLTLGKVNISSENPLSRSIIRVLSTSTGFPGRLVEIEELSRNTPTNPITQESMYRFKAQVDPRSNLLHLTDQSPATWFEYEKNLVSDQDRTGAKNLNFTYTVSERNTDKGIAEVKYPVPVGEKIDWANGPVNGVLNLDLEFELDQVKTINEITYTPFGLQDNASSPVLVKLVETSVDKNNWETLYPTNVYIAQDASLNTARLANEVVVGVARWDVPNDQVRYIRFHLEQKSPIDTKIGHLYYTTPRKVIRRWDETLNPPSFVEEIVGGERAQGPTATTSSPTKFYAPSFSLVESPDKNLTSGLVKRVEVFDGKRWAIGIKDISAKKVEYSLSGSIISKPFKIGGIVDRVSIDSSVYIPESFSAQTLWVKYYVSPNDGVNWFPISRIQDDYVGVPEILAFNDTIPVEFRESNVGYHTVAGPVKSLRVKIELSRPSDQSSKTPVVHWYRLKIKRR